MSRILCTSSNPSFIGYYSGLLNTAGYRTICVAEEEGTALELDKGGIDLFIIDLVLENSSKLSVVKIAKESHVPVVVISRDIARLFHPPYADLYLEPPVAAAELLAIINEFLSFRAPAEEPDTRAAVA